MAKKSPHDLIDDILERTYADPLSFVISMYPWSTDPTIQQVKLRPEYAARFPGAVYGPDLWACKFLDKLGADIRKRKFNGRDAVMPVQKAIASGHGIGKSVMVAWLVGFIMNTRPFSKGTVTAMTADQLRSKTWAEVGKWHKLSLTADRFEFTATRGNMVMRHKEFGDRWQCQAVTCREENSEAFAGQHAANATSFYIFDEASGVPSKIYEVRLGGLTDGEPMTFDFGNPTRNSGEFFNEFFGPGAKHYDTVQIDSRDVAIANNDYINRLRETYGEDSDIFRVRVRGLFPATGNSQFIGTQDVMGAQARSLPYTRDAALVMGVDVARFGEDDSVIKVRLGDDARSFPAKRYKGLDTVQLTGRITQTINEFRVLGMRFAGIFVDGGGAGGAVVDNLRHLGYNPTEVQFGGKPTDPGMYRFKGDEIWGKMKDHVRTRLVLPIDPMAGRAGEEPTGLAFEDAPGSNAMASAEGPDLKTQLTAREFDYTLKGQIHLEGKKDMKERGISSPDLADALALTYAEDVAPVDFDHTMAPAASLDRAWDTDPWGNS